MSQILTQLKQSQRIWQGQDRRQRRQALPSTGHAPLDQALHHGGWPPGALSELLLPDAGSGELQLLMPQLARLAQLPRWLFFCGCPGLPYAPALQAAGVATDRVLVLGSGKQEEQLWALEQALASGACSAALAWLPARLPQGALRKLQLAARKGDSYGFLLRPGSAAGQASPASLRLALAAESGRNLDIRVVKQPGGWSGQQVRLSLSPQADPLAAIPPAEWPVPSRQPVPRSAGGLRVTGRGKPAPVPARLHQYLV